MQDERLMRIRRRLGAVQAHRRQLLDQRKAIVDNAEAEAREDLTVAEDTEFRAITEQITQLDTDIQQLEERAVELEDEYRRDEEISRGAAVVRRGNQGGAYSSPRGGIYHEGGRSYFGDLVRQAYDPEAREHLRQHAMEQRDLNRTDGTGGAWVPPAWLMNQWVEVARPGRVTANLCTPLALPPGTDQINLPKVSTGTTTAVQASDNGSVSETDMADTSVQVPVITIAGQQDVAVQLLDQSPLQFDQVVFQDLAADFAKQVNAQVISGSGNSGQAKGILTASNTIAVTYTDTTPTTGELYGKLAEALSLITSQRYAPPTTIVMHPRRWAWLLSARDSDGRPLVVPGGNGPTNAQGVGRSLDGYVGDLLGLPVYVDAGFATNLGSGTNEDRILVMKADDCWLWESAIRTRVLPDVGSGTLTTRLQLYGYAAFTAERQPKSIGILAGTGLVTPVFA